MTRASFWADKRVFLTGHTGFKGGWLGLWLQALGAKVFGYSLAPPTQPSLYELASVSCGMEEVIADIQDGARLLNELENFGPDIVIHMAAQSLVRESYTDPVGTYRTNVLGTIHLLEAVRKSQTTRVVINVTSDKCYENREWFWGYRETDAMGGHDPYASSKGCAELVTQAYFRSFFGEGKHTAAIASARAGNVIGGGDWARDRLVPDVMRAFFSGQPVDIRYPKAVRPWQHVLEPLRGYLLLAERLWHDGTKYAGGWNFGPHTDDIQSVSGVLNLLRDEIGPGLQWRSVNHETTLHEANVLKLDISKAQELLGWKPVWSLKGALRATAAWYLAAHRAEDMRAFTLAQIDDYSSVVDNIRPNEIETITT